MPTVFTRIINRELPARFVYEDDASVAFLSIEPLTPGHTLVVPRIETDHWLDLDMDTLNHLMAVARRVGEAIDSVYHPTKIAIIIAGLEVPHVHIHVVALNEPADLDFVNADRNPDIASLDDAARLIAAAIGDWKIAH